MSEESSSNNSPHWGTRLLVILYALGIVVIAADQYPLELHYNNISNYISSKTAKLKESGPIIDLDKVKEQRLAKDIK